MERLALAHVPADMPLSGAFSVGPLFLGFNILLRPIQLEKLEIEIAGAVST